MGQAVRPWSGWMMKVASRRQTPNGSRWLSQLQPLGRHIVHRTYQCAMCALGPFRRRRRRRLARRLRHHGIRRLNDPGGIDCNGRLLLLALVRMILLGRGGCLCVEGAEEGGGRPRWIDRTRSAAAERLASNQGAGPLTMRSRRKAQAAVSRHMS